MRNAKQDFAKIGGTIQKDILFEKTCGTTCSRKECLMKSKSKPFSYKKKDFSGQAFSVQDSPSGYIKLKAFRE